VARVGGDDRVVAAAGGALYNGDVDHVVVVRSTGELADVARLVSSHRLDVATGQHAGQARLAGAASPGFGHDRRGNDRYHLFCDQPDVQCPHVAVVPFASDERTGVVGNPRHLRGPFRRRAVQKLPSSSQTLGKLFLSQRPDIGFPCRHAPASGFQAKTTRGGLGDPRTEG